MFVPADATIAGEGFKTRVLRGGKGETVLFLHGAAGPIWTSFHDGLAENYEVLITEHPGFGSSPDLPNVESMAELATHYRKVIALLGLSRMHLVGSSLGGWLASELALLDPGKIRSLTLLSPVGLFPREESSNASSPTRESATRMLYYDQSIADHILEKVPSETEKAVVERNRASTARYGGKLRYNPKLGENLERLNIPAFIIWGADDRLVPASHAAQWGMKLNAEARVLPECGHLPHVEKSADTARLVLSQLEKTMTSTASSLSDSKGN